MIINFCFLGCAEGKYGTECERDCNCQGHAYPGCDIDTGNCTCLPGWTGSDCNKGTYITFQVIQKHSLYNGQNKRLFPFVCTCIIKQEIEDSTLTT